MNEAHKSEFRKKLEQQAAESNSPPADFRAMAIELAGYRISSALNWLAWMVLAGCTLIGMSIMSGK
jgi:hypothetical protein